MPGLLRSVWNEPRPPHVPPLSWRDWALVALLVPTAVLEGVLRPDLPWRTLSVVVAVGLVPTLLWRRSRPLPAVAVAFGTCAVVSVPTDGGPELNVLVFMLLLGYSLIRWGSGRQIVIGTAIIAGKLALSAALGHLGLGDIAAGLIILTSAGAIGAALRWRSRARQRELDQVKLLERERLARDLHDTVAHHVSAMAIRAQAGLATAGTHPDAAADALRVIEAEASRALAEMRGMVRVLRRDEPAELAPTPCVGDIAGLADPSRPGPAVEVQISGEVDDLPPAVAAALYRLAQESVTNARRHARHAKRIEVRVAADNHAVRLHVSDDGDPTAGRPTGSGYGLVGMIERAGLLGGTCEAGPNADRGWTVAATLPRTGPGPR
nr:sensor histidine kinase [Micromonospora sp. DSM 115978]